MTSPMPDSGARRPRQASRQCARRLNLPSPMDGRGRLSAFLEADHKTVCAGYAVRRPGVSTLRSRPRFPSTPPRPKRPPQSGERMVAHTVTGVTAGPLEPCKSFQQEARRAQIAAWYFKSTYYKTRVGRASIPALMYWYLRNGDSDEHN
jgi:hypothetical protein